MKNKFDYLIKLLKDLSIVLVIYIEILLSLKIIFSDRILAKINNKNLFTIIILGIFALIVIIFIFFSTNSKFPNVNSKFLNSLFYFGMLYLLFYIFLSNFNISFLHNKIILGILVILLIKLIICIFNIKFKIQILNLSFIVISLLFVYFIYTLFYRNILILIAIELFVTIILIYFLNKIPENIQELILNILGISIFFFIGSITFSEILDLNIKSRTWVFYVIVITIFLILPELYINLKEYELGCFIIVYFFMTIFILGFIFNIYSIKEKVGNYNFFSKATISIIVLTSLLLIIFDSDDIEKYASKGNLKIDKVKVAKDRLLISNIAMLVTAITSYFPDKVSIINFFGDLPIDDNLKLLLFEVLVLLILFFIPLILLKVEKLLFLNVFNIKDK